MAILGRPRDRPRACPGPIPVSDVQGERELGLRASWAWAKDEAHAVVVAGAWRLDSPRPGRCFSEENGPRRRCSRPPCCLVVSTAHRPPSSPCHCPPSLPLPLPCYRRRHRPSSAVLPAQHISQQSTQQSMDSSQIQQQSAAPRQALRQPSPPDFLGGGACWYCMPPWGG